MASQTSNGAWVPIPCTRSAESRQTTPCGTRSATSASDRCSLMACPGRPYTPRATLSSFPAATSRLSTTVGSSCCARSRARSSGRALASSRTACSCVEWERRFMMQVCCNIYAFVNNLHAIATNKLARSPTLPCGIIVQLHPTANATWPAEASRRNDDSELVR